MEIQEKKKATHRDDYKKLHLGSLTKEEVSTIRSLSHNDTKEAVVRMREQFAKSKLAYDRSEPMVYILDWYQKK